MYVVKCIGAFEMCHIVPHCNFYVLPPTKKLDYLKFSRINMNFDILNDQIGRMTIFLFLFYFHTTIFDTNIGHPNVVLCAKFGGH
jgi:hypothetical protein